MTKRIHANSRVTVLRGDPYCLYCLKTRSTTIDHIIPTALGGSNLQQNLAGCCHECNNIKDSKSLYHSGLTLHPSLRLIDICAERGVDPYAYNDRPGSQIRYVSASEVHNHYDTSLGERLSALGMKGLRS